MVEEGDATRIRLEKQGEPLLERPAFLARLAKYFAVASAVILLSLGGGMLGYHALAHLSWVDSFLNAAMILGGMGPVDVIHGTAGKVFAGCYALFSGIVFLAAAGLLLAPVVHRALHHFHVDED